jgi:hypothetical protein
MDKETRHPFDSVDWDIFRVEPYWAKLKLALLKENIEFRKFFEEHQENVSTIRSLEPKFDELTPEDGDQYWELGSQYNSACMPFYKCFKSLGINTYALQGPYRRFIEVIDFLDPKTDIDELPEKVISTYLPRIFYSHGVEQIEYEHGEPTEGLAVMTFLSIQREGLKQYERFLKIDLRKKKKQLIKEFSTYLDIVYRWRNYAEFTSDKKRIKRYSAWKSGAEERYRKETWNQLKVWKMRRHRRSFREISRELGMTEDAAKKAFYAIYEKIQGTPYDPDKLRKDIWSVKKSELQKVCDSCPDRENCMILCPDVLLYVEQDLASSTEKLLTEDSESLKDYLTRKDSL